MRSRSYPRQNQQRGRRRPFRSLSRHQSPSQSNSNSDTNWVPFNYTNDEKWKTFYANGRPKFQKNCILFCVVVFESDESDVFWKESHSHIGVHHAEIKALNRIGTKEKNLRTRARLVQLFMSYSPCGTCTDAIIPFTEKRPNCNVCIAFSCLYRHKKEEVHRDGLRQLNAEPRISIKVFTKIEWKTLAEATGRQYRGNKERDVWDKKWQLELNNILSYEDEPKVFTTVKKPELELSVSNLPSIVPDLPQELGGNARTVLNKPKEITSTSNKAKGKLFQVQPGGKKNNMVKNGVFPGDSAVSKSSSLQDQNRPNEISPKSTDHTQPQKEHTVIDIPEPKADQEQAVHPKKRRKEMIAIIIFVILISLAIILLIVLGQWS